MSYLLSAILIIGCIARQRGSVDIASTSETEGPGSNPARVYVRFLWENIEMLLCKIDLICIVCVLIVKHKALVTLKKY
jgi:hypothetical protein